MPTYDYICDACGHELEEFQSMSAKPLRKCPGCGKLKLKRLIGTGAGIIFKGSGFYETDYRSDGYKKDAKAEKDAAKPKKESKGEKKSGDTKPSTSASGPKKSKSPKKPPSGKPTKKNPQK
jgi:putative FmdB family regulatory protein